LGVDVQLGRAFWADRDSAAGYDSVVVATGSVPVMTGFTTKRPGVIAIPGVELPHVLSTWDVLEADAEVGPTVVVIDDDPHGQAVNIADYLANHGHRVTLVCRAPTIGIAFGSSNLEPMYRLLFGAGVRILENTWVDEIVPGFVDCSNIYTGRHVERCEAATVILAAGNEVVDDAYKTLRVVQPDLNVVRVGDCLAPRRIDDAIWDGYEVGRKIGRLTP
jgi:pyruvate/2-oxoglutarate dehydrogenase complex dihydrolipoamide dehydrogenase (E3) component